VTYQLGDLLERAFAPLRAKMEAALEIGGGTHAFEDVIAAVRVGRMQAFFSPSGESVVVTEVQAFPRLRMLLVFLAAGDLRDASTLQQMLVDFAKEQGCARIRMEGRAGWIRWLHNDGWRKTGVVVHKDLGGEA
jgi:hypothetical protein